jgi:hypothetical protein
MRRRRFVLLAIPTILVPASAFAFAAHVPDCRLALPLGFIAGMPGSVTAHNLGAVVVVPTLASNTIVAPELSLDRATGLIQATIAVATMFGVLLSMAGNPRARRDLTAADNPIAIARNAGLVMNRALLA